MRLTVHVLTLLGCVSAFRTSRLGENLQKRQSSNNGSYPIYTFDQMIDHFPDEEKYAPHTNDTFKQRYVFDSTYYKPGGPVFLYIGGETHIEYRFENLDIGIVQILMAATNGLGIILENRYYGHSYPFSTSSTDQLRFLTNEQSIADNAYFAQHVNIPGFNTTLKAPGTPWILYGGSLAGAQTAFSVKTYPDVLWGGIAASGVTKVKTDYVEWYDPIQKYGPQDCIGSINAIVANVDRIFSSGDAKAINQMKTVFGLEAVTDNRDFAAGIAFPLGGPFDYPTNTWQELNWNYPTDGSQDFWYFCDNVTNFNAPHSISQVDYALAQYTDGQPWPNLGNYANYIKKYVIPLCGGAPINSVYCFGTQNQTYWKDTANSGTRSYLYTMCTEQGTYQVARTNGQPTLLSTIVQRNYTQQWCKWAFPAGKYNSIPPNGPNVAVWNQYGGYNVSADRLAHIDGEQDVWLQLCYHSNDAPKRLTPTLEDSYLHPQMLISGSGHHWDSYSNGYDTIESEPQFIREAHKWEIRIVQKWVEMFEEQKTKRNLE